MESITLFLKKTFHRDNINPIFTPVLEKDLSSVLHVPDVKRTVKSSFTEIELEYPCFGGHNRLPIKRDVYLYRTEDGKKVVLPKSLDVTKQLIPPETLIEHISRLPQKLKECINEVQLLDYYRPDANNAETIFAAEFRGNLYFFRNDKLDKFEVLDNFRHAIIHESAHAFDRYSSYSHSFFWKEAQMKDKDLGSKQWVSQQAKDLKSLDEDFADAVDLYFTSHEKFSKKFPNRAQFLEQILQ